MAAYYFVIVSQQDSPIFEIDFTAGSKAAEARNVYRVGDLTQHGQLCWGIWRKDEPRHLNQFVTHASLDLIDEQAWSTPAHYLKLVDKFNEWFVSAFVTTSRVRFVMLHDCRNDEGIGKFFQDMYETYIKLSMNPFYKLGSAIKSPAFEKKARFFARRYLIS